MRIGKTLISIVLTGALALSNVGCKTKSSKNELATKAQIRTISGKIVNIDEDEFPIYCDIGGSSFQYELIRIKDKEGKIKQLLSPMPTGYCVGDEVTFKYVERKSITFSELVEKYATHPRFTAPLQKGSVKMDGLLVY